MHDMIEIEKANVAARKAGYADLMDALIKNGRVVTVDGREAKESNVIPFPADAYKKGWIK